MLLHSLELVYQSMRGVMTNSIDRDQWLNVTSESRDRIQPFFFALGRNRTRDPRVAEPKRTPPSDYILPIIKRWWEVVNVKTPLRPSFSVVG
jgi:hypothetical protein